MTARILSGREIADAIKGEIAGQIADLSEVHGFSPALAVIRVGEDPASAVYVANKVRTSNEIGLVSELHHLPAETTRAELLDAIHRLNENENIDGILVQLPLPDHIDESEILEAIDPRKDVDGFHPVNVGRLSQGQQTLAPCTPAGVIEILKRSDIGIAGRHAAIIGRSNVVGKPMAMLLLQENATVTICHSRTVDLAEITNHADILVAAIGRPAFVGSAHIKQGATVIDVGINKISDPSQVSGLFPESEMEKRIAAIEKRGFTLIGDVNPKEAIEKAGAFTPVPGGVGLLTIAMLMKNTVEAARSRRGI
jgi:methylenetetrahydrofolate dehydrogenase (NADP+) / methenyltetrahydrofolate cyclohydrolase